MEWIRKTKDVGSANLVMITSRQLRDFGTGGFPGASRETNLG